ncbi:MAG: flagellar hook-length control protein FliK [Rhodanobacteraceae bacterium]
MSSLVVPAAPPPTTTGNGAGNGTANSAAPAAGDGRFGDTLRETQARPETQPRGRAAAQDPAPKHTGDNSDADKQGHSKDDEHAGKQADAKRRDSTVEVAQALPIAVALAPPTAAMTRQLPVASGKPLPAAPAKAPAAMAALAATAITQAQVTAGPGGGPVATAAVTVPDGDPGPSADLQTSISGTDPQAEAKVAKDSAPLRLGPDDFSANLTQLVGLHSAPASSPAQPPVQIAMQATPGPTPQFAQETAQHVAWLVGQGIQKAEIRLNPGKLGPIHVEIATHHDRVDVNFAVQHPQTVNALQQTLPQLQHMLAQQGLNLGQASVGQQAPGQQHAAFAQHAVAGGSGHDGGNAEPDAPPAWRTLRIATPGRVDDFA